MTKNMTIRIAVAAAAVLAAASGSAQQAGEKKPKPKAKVAAVAPGGLLATGASLQAPDVQRDFPAVCAIRDGGTAVAFIEYDGKADRVRMVSFDGRDFGPARDVSDPGNVYQPCLARDGNGTLWCVWSQMRRDGRWNLLARSVTGGKPQGEIITLDDTGGNDVLPVAKTDRFGRAWVAWQSFAGGNGDVFVKYYDPKDKSWSDVIRVTEHPAGDWEPRLAFGKDDEALVVFDSYRRGNYDVMLARVSPDGKKTLTAITSSPRYEARASADATPDGSMLWVAYEDGPERWGKDMGSEWRKIGGGLHYGRQVYLARIDLATGSVARVVDVTPLIPGLMPTLGTPNSSSICLPEVVVDGSGCPCLFFRYCLHGRTGFWQVALTRYFEQYETWRKPLTLANSAYCLDRRVAATWHDDLEFGIVAAWPSDGRTSKQQRLSGIHVATFWPDEQEKVYVAAPDETPAKRVGEPFQPVNNTPERARDDRHRWQFDDEEYTLYWADFHRHTDFSVCRTSDDGCILEHYRYAYDAAGLDCLSTTDHTDAGKVYHDYEWWQTQKLADMFHNPGYLLGFYAYEREQGWPYGHRNVIFLRRGGPIVYIKRANYAASRWATPLPPEDGSRKGELPPWQLWQLLRRSGMRLTTIEHTPAGGMGTDWSVYKQIDQRLENIVEIYQGSRASYEGVGAPQPAVAKQGGPMEFGKFNAGVYQNALSLGHKLGAFASSDHRSTNVSFGGVYVRKFDREGVFDAMDARRTVAATDKIFMEFSCNGHMLGQVFETSARPELTISIRGTAPLKAVTVIRNEMDIKRFSAHDGPDFDVTFADPQPLAGENRYYVRV